MAYSIRSARMAGKTVCQVVTDGGIVCCNEATEDAAEIHMTAMQDADKRNADALAAAEKAKS